MLMPEDILLSGQDKPLLVSPNDLSLEEVVRRKLQEYFRQTPKLEPCELYDLVISQVEKPLIELTLENTSGNQLKAAEILGLNRNTLRKKIAALKIQVKK
jgi:two-component system nitrogen regulation response regulator GlnG